MQVNGGRQGHSDSNSWGQHIEMRRRKKKKEKNKKKVGQSRAVSKAE